MKLGQGFYPEPHPVLSGTDADELAHQVLTALAEPLVASTRLAGRSWVEQNHHPDLVVDQLAALYDGLSPR
jgi:hypothetical protein